MTPTPADIQKELKQMAQDNPEIVEFKHKFRLSRLERMRVFYQGKLETAPKVQWVMFSDFVVALAYAEDILNKYQELTTKLAKLTEGKSHGDKTENTN